MRVPLSWLRSFCDPDLGVEEIAERLDLTGTELERIEHVGVGSPDGFVVGRVLRAERHPDADRLTVCEVDDGSGEPRTIVCGAPNVAAGQAVAVARPGALLPDGRELGEAELRGVRSSGMILADDELGISPDHDEIIVLADDLEPGAPLADVLPIADEVLELEITPNRPDCLAVYGVARELHAATGAPLAPDPAAVDAEPAGEGHPSDHVSVEIADPDVCLRFTARVFEDVRIGPSPEWLKQRLTAAGQRPISNVVDITNYVMLELGQPLHAFDLERVRGASIVVRRARDGETMTTLDGEERSFDAEMALVCDAEGPSGIAGVMGGQISEVSGTTTRVLMEAATWVGPNVLRTSKALGLRSEASARFEKQLHPDQAIAAQRLAARLMVELCGARMVPGTIDVYPAPAPLRTLELRRARVAGLLGADIAPEEIRSILQRLGFSADDGDTTIEVTVPSFRDADVQREADLIEELARIHGLDELPLTLPARRGAVGGLSASQRLRRRLEDALRDRGLDEVVGWSFTSRAALATLRDEAVGEALALANPLSEEHELMRPLLLPGLLDAARHNAAHGASGVRLFESAHVYAPSDRPLADVPAGSPRGLAPARERHHLAGLLAGESGAGWRTSAPPADFFAAKGLVEALFAVTGAEPAFTARARGFLHPGRSAVVHCGEREAGWVGELHPLVAREWGLEAAATFEVDLDLLAELAPGPPAYAPVPAFPAVREDMAVVVPADVPAARVVEAVRAGAGELLAAVRVFDVYSGEQVGAGNRSLTLALEFRAPDRTLTDDEVAARRGAIESAVAGVGGRPRG